MPLVAADVCDGIVRRVGDGAVNPGRTEISVPGFGLRKRRHRLRRRQKTLAVQAGEDADEAGGVTEFSSECCEIRSVDHQGRPPFVSGAEPTVAAPSAAAQAHPARVTNLLRNAFSGAIVTSCLT